MLRVRVTTSHHVRPRTTTASHTCCSYRPQREPLTGRGESAVIYEENVVTSDFIRFCFSSPGCAACATRNCLRVPSPTGNGYGLLTKCFHHFSSLTLRNVPATGKFHARVSFSVSLLFYSNFIPSLVESFSRLVVHLCNPILSVNLFVILEIHVKGTKRLLDFRFLN